MTKLYKKLLAIMNETKAIEKNLTIEFKTAKYKAVSESAVLNEIKPLLKKHGVMILPIETEMEQTGTLTKLTVKWKVVDCESGEFEILSSVGNGSDSQDKGSGKAFTYAYKALIQKTFMLFSGEDTDNEHSDSISEKLTKDPKKLSKLTELFDNLDVAVQKAVLQRYKVKEIQQLPVDLWDRAIEGMSK